MNQKWNLQDIRPAGPKKSRVPTKPLQKKPSPVISDREDADEAMSIDIINGNKKKGHALLISFVIFFIVVGGGVVASILMGGADVTIYPKFKEPNVNATFTTALNPQDKELPYEIMTLEAEGERQVSASGQETITKQTEGTIFIYNNFSSDPVRLVTNTRFESSNGLIFKIKDPAVVPGYTTDTDGSKKPGVVTAVVYADEVGEEYNIKPNKFTIPGFKGEPEYDDIYAESTVDFTGGFNGKKFIIDEDELKTAQQALRLELRNSLLERIDSEKPAGFVVFQGAVTFTYESLPAVAYGDNLATIKEKVFLRIPLFKEESFASFVAAATVPGYEGEDVRIEDYSSLSFEYKNATTSSSDIGAVTELLFNLTGRPTIVWEYDEGKLKTDLLGKNRTAFTAILNGYPSIEKGSKAVIRPFWKSKFPTKLEEINLVEIVKEE